MLGGRVTEFAIGLAVVYDREESDSLILGIACDGEKGQESDCEEK